MAGYQQEWAIRGFQRGRTIRKGDLQDPLNLSDGYYEMWLKGLVDSWFLYILGPFDANN